jgi:tetraacyldisaccharide 4'-kinase
MHRKRQRIAHASRVVRDIPVVCIGNLVVGGSGKSPLIQSLCMQLKQAGFRPGIVSRGYGGRVRHLPIEVSEYTTPQGVGDEPVMLFQQTHVPVVVCRDRARAVERLHHHHPVDVILADDGLQNTRLWRDLSICVFHDAQGIGNGLELPFGPLREPLTVVDAMDAVVVRGASDGEASLQRMGIATSTPVFTSESHMVSAYRSDRPEEHHPLTSLADLGEFHAFAGIASPHRFFDGLKQAGLSVIEHQFPDHYAYQTDDVIDGGLMITTEKDAVKLVHFTETPFWVVPLESTQAAFEAWLIAQLQQWSRL